MKFDIIIATYNRKKSLEILVSQILECTQLPENIIVVDSSAEEDEEIQLLDRVKYIRSSHGNQPYQRYVGFLAAKHEILVYFDDDMRITDKTSFDKILSVYDDEEIVGVQPNFTSQHDFFDNQIPKSKIKQAGNGKFLKCLKKLSGYPLVENGKFWLAGIKGKDPENLKTLEWFKGPVFSARRNFLYDNFNFTLFDQFERRIGTGEDAVLGFTLSKRGDVVYLSETLFHHDDQSDSTYSSDFLTYGKRVAYSRLYLSFEYARLSNTSNTIAFLHYNWYMLWRLIGMSVNQMIDFKDSRSKIMKGYMEGVILALKERHHLAKYDNGNKWKRLALDDIKS